MKSGKLHDTETIKKNQINFGAEEHNDRTENFYRELQQQTQSRRRNFSKFKDGSFEITQSEKQTNKQKRMTK